MKKTARMLTPPEREQYSCVGGENTDCEKTTTVEVLYDGRHDGAMLCDAHAFEFGSQEFGG